MMENPITDAFSINSRDSRLVIASKDKFLEFTLCFNGKERKPWSKDCDRRSKMKSILTEFLEFYELQRFPLENVEFRRENENWRSLGGSMTLSSFLKKYPQKTSEYYFQLRSVVEVRYVKNNDDLELSHLVKYVHPDDVVVTTARGWNRDFASALVRRITVGKNGRLTEEGVKNSQKFKDIAVNNLVCLRLTAGQAQTSNAVSYTHLTLPTIA